MRFKQALRQLSNPALPSLALLWLILLLIVGTIAQKYEGLYAAQQAYFASYFFTWGFIPLPGAKSAILVICLGIIAKLSQPYVWRWRQIGSNITHAGVLFLLTGSLLIGQDKLEGALVLDQGQDKNYSEDYYSTELVLMPVNSSNRIPVVFRQNEFLQANRQKELLSSANLPFDLQVTGFFSNVDLERVSSDDEQAVSNIYKGFAKIYKLVAKDSELKREENLSGLNFAIYDSQGQLLGRYAIFEQMSIIQTINHQQKTYQAIIRAERHYLPFTLRLVDFKATYHPASQVARSYESVVNLEVGDIDAIDGIDQRAVISMNQPLRYKDWTIYQSAFISNAERETSILIAVRNSARLIPYIGGLIIACGLLLHLFIRLSRKRLSLSQSRT